MTAKTLQGFPLSPQQRRIWSLQQLGEGLYVECTIQVKGHLDITLLQTALRETCRKHEVLRVSFHVRPELSFPLQVVEETGDLEFTFAEVTEEKSLQAHFEAFHAISNDSQCAPAKVLLVKLMNGNHMLTLRLSALRMDAFSLKLFCREVVTCYTGNTLSLGNNELIGYSQFSEWQNNLLSTPDVDAAAFWGNYNFQNYFSLKLPLENESAARGAYKPEAVELLVDAAILSQLRQVVSDVNTELSTFLLACWKMLIYKYTGINNLTIGYVCNEREYEELRSLIGPVAKIFPIASHIDSSTSIVTLIKQLSLVIPDVLGWQDYFSFGETNASQGKDQTFPLAFEFLELQENISGNNEVNFSVTDFRSNTDPARLKLACNYFESRLLLSFHYHPHYYDRSVIELVKNHFLALLHSILLNKEETIERLSVLSKTVAEPLSSHGVGASTNWQDQTVVSLFEQQVRQVPQSVALRYRRESISYEQLNEQANRLSHFLADQYQLEADQLVGVLMDRSPEMVISILAILKAGGAYLPIDPTYPQQRLHYMLSDSECRLVLVDVERDGLPSLCPVLVLNQLPLQDYPATNLLRQPLSHQLAYVLYTSGSTGQPKGCQIEHGNLTNYLTWACHYYLNDADLGHFSLFTSLAFDLTVTSLFCPLLSGKQLLIHPSEDSLNTILLESFSIHTATNVVKLTPSHISLLAYLPLTETNVRKVIVGGEALTHKHVSVLRNINPLIEIINEYGPTEATVGCIVETIGNGTGKILIGRPIANTHAYILDATGRPCLVGEIGEIYIGGAGLARGYHRRESLTQEKFVAASFSEGERLYRTGDLGRLLPEGSIEFLGRRDEQVKIRGYRIELGEIEQTLLQHELLHQALVIVLREGEDVSLVAYYKADHAMEQQDLQKHLRAYLPEHMVPAHFIHLLHFPLTSNGKVDRSKLPELKYVHQALKYVAAQTISEKQMVAIWEEILVKDRIGILDNFFAIGGDSIKGIRMLSAINKQFESHLEIKDIYKYQNIKELVAYLTKSVATSLPEIISQVTSHVLKIKEAILQDEVLARRLPSDWVDLYPMSDIEIGMIYHNVVNFSASMYHDQTFHQIEEQEFDLETFKRAFYLLVNKHEILRTSFHLTDFGKPLQIVHSGVNSDTIRYTDISHLEATSQKLFLEVHLNDDRQTAFEESHPGLWRMTVFKLSNKQYGILWVTHHAILDGWSNASLMTELSITYYKLKENNQYKPLGLKASYKNFFISQLACKQSPGIKEYWKATLNNYKYTPLPFGKSAAEAVTSRIKNFSFTIDSRLSAPLDALATKLEISVKDIYCAAFVELIRQTNNTDDVTIGLVTNGRPEVEDGDKILGCFLNTVPLRMKIPEQVKAYDYISRVSNQLREIKLYDKLSILEITSLIDIKKSPKNSIFDITFNYVDFHIYDDTHQSTKVEKPLVDWYDNSNTAFDFVIRRTGGKLTFSITCLADLYSETELNNLSEYFKKILMYLLTEDHGALIEEPILTTLQWTQVSSHGVGASTNWQDQTVVSLFEQQVRQVPQSVALRYRRESISYEQLNEQANRLSHFLADQYQLEADQLVGVLMDRSPEMVISILAILKAGGAYLPIDPTYPQQRLHYMLSDSECRLVLVDVERDGLPSLCPVLVLNQLPLQDYPATNLLRQPLSHQLAYVLYTSGSTGQPKGCQIEHGNLTNYLTWACHYYLNDADLGHFSLFTSLAFDLTVTSLFCPLLSGKQLLIHPSEDSLNTILLESFSIHTATNVVKLTPSHISLLAYLPLTETNVRKVIVGGEALTHKHVSVLRNINPLIEIINEYGPTEATVGCIVETIGNGTGKILIGRPIANTHAYILDATGRPCLVGEIGEIYIGGAGLARGYHRRESLTQEKFVAASFSEGERLYRTGDLGRLLPEGSIEFLGRRDEQVKIRGYRIELGEIEQTLLQHELLHQALVIVLREGEDVSLVAYYKADHAMEQQDLQKHLRAYLPEHMVPAHFIHLLHFPLTSNGKVDRSKLPELQQGAHAVPQKYAAPENKVQEKLALMWSEILEKNQIGIRDNFFELGGHSLKTIQLFAKIHKEFNVRIEIQKMFKYPTIEQLAKVIKESGSETIGTITPVAPSAHYNLSNAQRRLWILHQLDKKQTAYNIIRSLYIDGNLDLKVFENAVRKVINRHESLRTTFIEVNGEPRQQIADPGETDFRVAYLDFRYISGSEQAAAEEAAKEVSTAFDLATGPLLRIKMLHLSNQRYWMLLSVHHIVSDGWSMEVMFNEILSCYLSNPEDHGKLAALSLQYKDFAEWQHDQLTKDAFMHHKKYWKTQLGGNLPILNLPSDLKRPAVKTFYGGTHIFEINPALMEPIKQMTQTHEVTLFMVLLAGIKAMLFKYTGDTDILVGSPVAGRQHPDLENQIGFFVNTLPLRSRFRGHDKFSDLLLTVKEVTLNAFEHQEYPFDEIVKDLALIKDPSRSPLFDVMVALQNTTLPYKRAQLPHSIQLVDQVLEGGTSQFDLLFIFTEVSTGLEVKIDYSTDIFLPESIVIMEERLQNLLKDALKNPDKPLSDLACKANHELEMLKINLEDDFDE